MALNIISREEFDRRLEQSTERMRRKRLALEAQAAELEELVRRCVSGTDEVTEADLTRSLLRLSEPAFTRVWDNDDDAVYDQEKRASK